MVVMSGSSRIVFPWLLLMRRVGHGRIDTTSEKILEPLWTSPPDAVAGTADWADGGQTQCRAPALPRLRWRSRSAPRAHGRAVLGEEGRGRVVAAEGRTGPGRDS